MNGERMIPVGSVGDLLEARGLPRPAKATLHRWFGPGVRGRRLETMMVGGRRYTSHEALGRFLGDPDARTARETSPAPQRVLEAPGGPERAAQIRREFEALIRANAKTLKLKGAP